jgi:hypothetical protein
MGWVNGGARVGSKGEWMGKQAAGGGNVAGTG